MTRTNSGTGYNGYAVDPVSRRPPSHDRLAHMADNIRQLIEPIHVAHHRRLVTHPALLDQLRAACVPGNTVRGPERHQVPRSRPPLRLDAVDTLSVVYVELAGWHSRLRLSSPPHGVDWHKAVLRNLVGVWPNLDPGWQEWLAAEAESWWEMAARASGWRPDELRRLR